MYAYTFTSLSLLLPLPVSRLLSPHRHHTIIIIVICVSRIFGTCSCGWPRSQHAYTYQSGKRSLIHTSGAGSAISIAIDRTKLSNIYTYTKAVCSNVFTFVVRFFPSLSLSLSYRNKEMMSDNNWLNEVYTLDRKLIDVLLLLFARISFSCTHSPCAEPKMVVCREKKPSMAKTTARTCVRWNFLRIVLIDVGVLAVRSSLLLLLNTINTTSTVNAQFYCYFKRFVSHFNCRHTHTHTRTHIL